MTNLDAEYGVLCLPQPRYSGNAVDEWEKKHRPNSWTILNRQTAKQLRAFMQDIKDGFAAGRVLTSDIIIIWVIDEFGDVRLAIEEMVFDGEPTGLAKLQSFPLTKSVPKLGHPSLLGIENLRSGRIAGEIRLYDMSGFHYWTINRKSARYGHYDDRMYVHLKNAANKFRDFGIELSIDSDFS